jgi:hypothetical protein
LKQADSLNVNKRSSLMGKETEKRHFSDRSLFFKREL